MNVAPPLMRAPQLSVWKLVPLFVCRPVSFAWAFEIQNIISAPRALFSPKPLAMSTSPIEGHGPQTFKVLGICGGIGSGKSHASKLLVSELHCLAHLDADSLAHSVYSPGSQAVKDIIAEFGKEILLDADKEEIDRKKLGAIVFSDPSAMSVSTNCGLFLVPFGLFLSTNWYRTQPNH